jgi:hypothetical protein
MLMLNAIKNKIYGYKEEELEIADEDVKVKLKEREENIKELQDELIVVLDEYGDLSAGEVVSALVGLGLSATDKVYEESPEDGKVLRKVVMTIFELWRKENGV